MKQQREMITEMEQQIEKLTSEEAIAIGKRIKDLRTTTTVGQMIENCQRIKNQWEKVSNRKEQPQGISERLYTLGNIRNKKTMVSAETFADLIGVSRSTVIRAEEGELKRVKNSTVGEKGEFRLKDEHISWICILTHTHKDYIYCKTDIKEYSLYEKEWQEAEWEGLQEHSEKEKARIAHYNSLFDACGFAYEYIENNARYDFQEFNTTGEQYAGPHKITDKDKTFAPLYLSENELSELISKLQSCIALECFHIRRGRENGNG